MKEETLGCILSPHTQTCLLFPQWCFVWKVCCRLNDSEGTRRQDWLLSSNERALARYLPKKVNSLGFRLEQETLPYATVCRHPGYMQENSLAWLSTLFSFRSTCPPAPETPSLQPLTRCFICMFADKLEAGWILSVDTSDKIFVSFQFKSYDYKKKHLHVFVIVIIVIVTVGRVGPEPLPSIVPSILIGYKIIRAYNYPHHTGCVFRCWSEIFHTSNYGIKGDLPVCNKPIPLSDTL